MTAEAGSGFSSGFSPGFGATLTPTTGIISVDDIPDSIASGVDPALLKLMVDGANAMAERLAPCLFSDDPPPTAGQLAEARLVLIGAVDRWAQAGTGAFSQQTAGPFSVTTDTRQGTYGFNLWPSEITRLQDICSGDDDGGAGDAFTIDTAPGGTATGPYWWGYEVGNHPGPSIVGPPIEERAYPR